MTVVGRGAAAAGSEFVSEADWVPDFWNFLLGLDPEDLIPELVQNDIDQDATRTIISFERNRLVCEGNGRPVDSAGWQRLRKIRGAGESVPAKHGKIGVKNHGLKAAFTLGDRLELLSDGQAIVQTLYARGEAEPPYPGASASPQPDPRAPSTGCRVVITYRVKELRPRQGEAIVLGSPLTSALDELFVANLEKIPEQFAGIVTPEVAPRYEIVLRHWRLGEAVFEFRCSRPRRAAKSIEDYRRRCLVSGSVEPLPEGLEEHVARRLLPLKGQLRKRVPDFFRRRDRFFIEVSWRTNRRGRPQRAIGHYRYPIGYPPSVEAARTGHGVSYSAPLISDTERHGPAWNDATSAGLRERCEELLLDVMARHLVPRWGAEALRPLHQCPGSEHARGVVRTLLADLASRGALPTVTWKSAVAMFSKRTRTGGAVRPPPTATESGPPRYRFVIPAMRTVEKAIHPQLALVCPSRERQLDPRIDSEFLGVLAESDTPGFGEVFVTFDERDAICRAAGEGNEYFASCPDLDVEMAHPRRAQAYLDIILEALDANSMPLTEDAVQRALLLPDSQCRSTPFANLHFSASLPSGIPGLRLPSLLHPDLARHPLLRRKKWRRPRFTLATFLQGGVLQESDEDLRGRFWDWLQRAGPVASRDRVRLAEIPIWPDEDGNLRPLREMCEPRSPRASGALGSSIHRPHKQVLKSKLATRVGHGPASLRRSPTAPELEHWFARRLAEFELNAQADEDAVVLLKRLESDVALLVSEFGLASLKRCLASDLPALAQDHSIRPRRELVLPAKSVERLALPPRFLLADVNSARAAQRLSPAMSEPVPEMLVAAFAEDGLNFGALQARLESLLTATRGEESTRDVVADMPIVPVHGRAHAPNTLAFKGTRGDYWGSWKTQVSTKGLSQDDQRRYLDVGVTSATPHPGSSREFFRWLSEQEQDLVQLHVTCVVRHLLHPAGPRTWAAAHPYIPVIPTTGMAGVGLVPLRVAQNNHVYLADFPGLAEQVIQTDAAVSLAIARVHEVTEPATEVLRQLGVRSLREAVGDPECVVGHGAVRQPPDALLRCVEQLSSRHFRRTLLKRLDDLGVERDLVWRDWYDRVSGIGSIGLAETVDATYRLRRKSYHVPVDADLDPQTHVLWVSDRQRDVEGAFFQAVAGRCVFKPIARPVDLLALKRTLDLEVLDESFGKPDMSPGGREELEEEATDEMEETGESVFGHAPFDPDPSRNVPQPAPLPPGDGGQPRSGIGGQRPSAQPRPGKSTPTPAQELQHTDALKTEHYASHCQMCLSERAPSELAPRGSYVEWEEVRRSIVQSHHVDPKSGGGARHAGNLILLCKLHHDNYGRRLTRQAVLVALKTKATKRTVLFDAGEAEAKVDGRVVEVVIPDTGQSVSLFFTLEHADYWLAHSGEAENASR